MAKDDKQLEEKQSATPKKKISKIIGYLGTAAAIVFGLIKVIGQFNGSNEA